VRIPSVGAPSRLLLPLAAYAALAVLARFEARPTAAAETGYLAFLAAGVLLAIGALAVRPDLEAGLASLLSVATVWLLPAGPGRGATLTVLLTAALAAVALRRLAHDRWVFSLANTVPVMVALQLLWRADALLAPLSRETGLEAGPLAATVFVLLVLPALGAAVIVLLSFLGWRPEAILTATVLALLLFPVLATAAVHDWREFLRLAAWLPILAPAAVFALFTWPPRVRRRWRSRAPHIWSIQAVWSGSLLLGATVLAGYPWLRTAPAESLLERVGLQPGWTAALVVLVASAAIGDRRWPHPARSTGLVLFLAAVLALPLAGPTVPPLPPPPKVNTTRSPPPVTGRPDPSRAVRVRVTTCPAVTRVALAVMFDLAGDATALGPAPSS